MFCFSDFTLPLCRIFGGNLLMLVTLLFYIAWWTVTFRPHRTGQAKGAGVWIALALVSGLASILILFSGIEALSQAAEGLTAVYILLGAIAFYIVLLAITRFVFQRPVTAELLLIILWAALEGSAVAVLQDNQLISPGLALTLAALLLLATGIGLLCYLLHYRLDERPRFWNGLIPLVVDAGVLIVFLAALVLMA